MELVYPGHVSPIPRVPRSAARTSRFEHTALPFDVVEGAIPNDLRGHFFLVAPAGTVPRTPPERRSTLLVGDGLVCRFDLDGNRITMTSRLARTHDFVADELTSRMPGLESHRFHTSGILRLGRLGARDFANTAFIPMKRGDEPTRLILAYDAGRPMEIDPLTLELVGPIGNRSEWRPEALPNAPFPIYLSPAHPVWDRRTGELFTLNYGRGVRNFLGTIPLVYLLTSVPPRIARAAERMARVLGFDAAYAWLSRRIEHGTTRIDRALERMFEDYFPEVPDTFTDLVRWDGSGRLSRWRLVLPNEREVAITQSVHQIAVTRNYVVVLHTGFKIGLAAAFNDPIPGTDFVERMAHAALTRPQLPTTTFYIIPRAALDDPRPARGDDGVARVTCRRVDLPIEADHFLADYDDANDRLTLHVAHAPATDLGEWIRPYDGSAWDAYVDPALFGMLAVGAMDVGRFGRYVVDGKTGRVEEARTMLDDKRTWGISLYAGRALNAEDPLPERIEHAYWCTVGFYPELLTELVFDLYRDYPHRIVPLDEILAMRTTGRPSTVLRVENSTLRIADSYELPMGTIAGSMQLVPRAGCWTSETDGYLIGTVYTQARTELWIFDASDLARGPIARLAAPGFEVGFSLHTAWLPTVEPRRSSYRITADAELRYTIEDPAVRRAFEQHLYPRFA